MKSKLIAALVVGICIMGWSVEAMAQQVTTVIRVNTDDTAAYLAWAEESIPIVMAATDVPGAGGVCVPMFGAEQEGDIYVWTTTPSFAAALSVDLDAPAAAREIAKVAPIRTVVSRDLRTTIKPGGIGATIEAGDSNSTLLLMVDTDQVDLYITLLTEIEEAAHQNGFPDVNWTASNVMTGEFQGRIAVLITAPTTERLGAMMDANQSESWATEFGRQFSGIRSIVQQRVNSCHVYAVQQ